MLGSFGTLLPIILMVLIIFGMKETSDRSSSGEATPLQNKDNYEPISQTGGWLGLFIVPQRFLKQTLTGIVLSITLQLTVIVYSFRVLMLSFILGLIFYKRHFLILILDY